MAEGVRAQGEENNLPYAELVAALMGANAAKEQPTPSPLSWEGMKGNLSNLYHSLAEPGLYMTPLGVPLAARDAYNAATTPPDPSKLSPLNAQGNRIPDLSTAQGWKSGLSDLYESGGDAGLALTGMFAGPKAKTANLKKLNEAVAMEAQGHSVGDIWKQKGWYNDPVDGWMFEIPDNKLALRGKKEDYFGNYKPDITGFDSFTHPELKKAYPFEEGILGTYGPGLERYGGSYTSKDRIGPGTQAKWAKNGIIELAGSSEEAARSTLAHELQHGVQWREGWTPGGSPAMFTKAQVKAEQQRLFDKMLNSDSVKQNSYPGWEKDSGATPEKYFPEEQVRYNMYMSLPGERLARKTEHRLDWTPEERANTSPEDPHNDPHAAGKYVSWRDESNPTPPLQGDQLSTGPNAPRTPTEVKVYHGTTAAEDFQKFDPRVGEGAFDEIPTVFFDKSPDIASEYASNHGEFAPNSRVIPAFIETKNFKKVDMEHSQSEVNLWEHKKQAHDEGYHGLIAQNIEDIGPPSDQYLTWTPNTVRSALSENQLYNAAPIIAGGMGLAAANQDPMGQLTQALMKKGDEPQQPAGTNMVDLAKILRGEQ